MSLARTALPVLLALAAAPLAKASDAPRAHENLIGAAAGLAAGHHDTAASFEGTLGRRLASRVSFEATGGWLGERGGDGWRASAGVLVDVVRTGTAVPYVAFGAGVLHARRGMMDGSMMGGYGRSGRMPGYGTPTSGRGPADGMMDGRYGDRGEEWGDGEARTDPMLSVGGGLRWDVTPRMFLRPDARALVITGGGGTRTRGLVTVTLGWRF